MGQHVLGCVINSSYGLVPHVKIGFGKREQRLNKKLTKHAVFGIEPHSDLTTAGETDQIQFLST
jgi:hypothetical protein